MQIHDSAKGIPELWIEVGETLYYAHKVFTIRETTLSIQPLLVGRRVLVDFR